MTGIDYLLDTNFLIGLLKNDPDTLALLAGSVIDAERCGFSSITRMELLGFPGLDSDEERVIVAKLAQLNYLAVTPLIEDEAIRLRRSYRIKLPDAIIAATALVYGAELLTHDKALRNLLDNDSLR
jgi:hypothetical protein